MLSKGLTDHSVHCTTTLEAVIILFTIVMHPTTPCLYLSSIKILMCLFLLVALFEEI